MCENGWAVARAAGQPSPSGAGPSRSWSKEIGVATRIAVGRKTPIVSITYRFEAPGVASPDAARLFSVRLVRTGVDAERRPGSPRDGYVPFG